MKEYIEREAAMCFNFSITVSLDELDRKIQVRDVLQNTMKAVVAHIEAIPAADVVEVVRCGECKHRDKVTGWCDDVQDYISNTNWFCAGGEKKGGANE